MRQYFQASGSQLLLKKPWNFSIYQPRSPYWERLVCIIPYPFSKHVESWATHSGGGRFWQDHVTQRRCLQGHGRLLDVNNFAWGRSLFWFFSGVTLLLGPLDLSVLAAVLPWNASQLNILGIRMLSFYLLIFYLFNFLGRMRLCPHGKGRMPWMRPSSGIIIYPPFGSKFGPHIEFMVYLKEGTGHQIVRPRLWRRSYTNFLHQQSFPILPEWCRLCFSMF